MKTHNDNIVQLKVHRYYFNLDPDYKKIATEVTNHCGYTIGCSFQVYTVKWKKYHKTWINCWLEENGYGEHNKVAYFQFIRDYDPVTLEPIE